MIYGISGDGVEVEAGAGIDKIQANTLSLKLWWVQAHPVDIQRRDNHAGAADGLQAPLALDNDQARFLAEAESIASVTTSTAP